MRLPLLAATLAITAGPAFAQIVCTPQAACTMAGACDPDPAGTITVDRTEDGVVVQSGVVQDTALQAVPLSGDAAGELFLLVNVESGDTMVYALKPDGSFTLAAHGTQDGGAAGFIASGTCVEE